MRVALVKDWLTSYGGSEEQLYLLHKIFPNAPIYTSVYDEKRLPQFKKAVIHELKWASWFKSGRRFEKLALVLPFYFSRLNLSDYDLVISVTSGFSKAVFTGPNTTHACICNTPIRFAWGFGNDQRGLLSGLAAPLFRWFDKWSAKRVNYFFANSKNVARRIKQIYKVESKVLYPPVHTEKFNKIKRSADPTCYVTIGRLVGYKKTDLIIEAFNELGLPLVVIGEGPEMSRLKQLAKSNVDLVGFADSDKINNLFKNAKAFVFAADEDFGIAPVEAMAAGCPVIAYAAGGALETVEPNKTGVYFKEQTVESLVKVISRYEQQAEWKKFNTKTLRAKAEEYSVANFEKNIKQIQALISKR